MRKKKTRTTAKLIKKGHPVQDLTDLQKRYNRLLGNEIAVCAMFIYYPSISIYYIYCLE